jgi:hypothetical protein
VSNGSYTDQRRNSSLTAQEEELARRKHQLEIRRIELEEDRLPLLLPCGVASEFSTERLPLRAAQGLALACLIGVKILYVLVGRSERRVAISSQ